MDLDLSDNSNEEENKSEHSAGSADSQSGPHALCMQTDLASLVPVLLNDALGGEKRIYV
jgi:hypothetical protein